MKKKLVLKLDLHDQRRGKQKAMTKVSGISGITSLGIDMKGEKMTVVGEFDAVEVTSKLRKLCDADIVTLGENKEEREGGGGGDGGRVQVNPYPPVVFPWHWAPNYAYYPPAVCECEQENPYPCAIC